jgi:hypothetical protein
MTAKILAILVISAIPALIAGYFYHLWNADQQRWAEAREAAELRYAEAVKADCQLGQITNGEKCAKASSYLTERAALSN